MRLAFGMGALGALLGVMIAWSASPVVATVMPLIFGLVGGVSGFSLLKMDLSKPNNQTKIATIGSSLLACCSACLVALVIAILIKPIIIDKYYNHIDGRYELASEQIQNNYDDAVQVILMRKRLEALGASNGEIRNILTATARLDDIATYLRQLSADTKKFIEEFEKLPQPDRDRISTGDSGYLYNNSKIFEVEKSVYDRKNEKIDHIHFRYLTNKMFYFGLGNEGLMRANADVYVKYPTLVEAITKLNDTIELGRIYYDIKYDRLRVANMERLIGVVNAASAEKKDENIIASRFD